MKRPRAGKVLSEYHVEYDILYLFAGELMASEAESIDEDHDVSIRYSMEDGRVAGAIIIDYSKKDATTLDSILPPVLQGHLPAINKLIGNRPRYLYKSDELLVNEIAKDYFSYLKGLDEEQRIDFAYNTEWVYVHNTTAIEMNRLSPSDVRRLFDGYKIVTGATQREVAEVLNYKAVAKCRGASRSRCVDLNFIREIHAALMAGIHESPGKFRTHDNICIVGVDKKLGSAHMIEEDLQEIIGKYYANISIGENPFEQAVLFHYKFESIHPFTDGNGRTGREILNYMLEAAGLLRLLFCTKRKFYLDAFAAGNQNDFVTVVGLFVEILTYDYLDVVKIKSSN